MRSCLWFDLRTADCAPHTKQNNLHHRNIIFDGRTNERTLTLVGKGNGSLAAEWRTADTTTRVVVTDNSLRARQPKQDRQVAAADGREREAYRTLAIRSKSSR